MFGIEENDRDIKEIRKNEKDRNGRKWKNGYC
jgi:hypothetical protein